MSQTFETEGRPEAKPFTHRDGEPRRAGSHTQRVLKGLSHSQPTVLCPPHPATELRAFAILSLHPLLPWPPSSLACSLAVTSSSLAHYSAPHLTLRPPEDPMFDPLFSSSSRYSHGPHSPPPYTAPFRSLLSSFPHLDSTVSYCNSSLVHTLPSHTSNLLDCIHLAKLQPSQIQLHLFRGIFSCLLGSPLSAQKNVSPRRAGTVSPRRALSQSQTSAWCTLEAC